MATVDMLEGALQDSMCDSETWDSASRIATNQFERPGSSFGSESMTSPIDQDNNSLDFESTHVGRLGREPTHEEIMEYLATHKLQTFMTEALMHIVRHLPPDPFRFLLDHIEAMVMKYLGAENKVVQELRPQTPAPPASPEVSPEQAEQLVKRIALVLNHPELTRASAARFARQFGTRDEAMTEENFSAFLQHLEKNWGVRAEDAKFMQEVLQRWRFRSNAANGTRGLPLWPLSKDDFSTAFPYMMRALRDVYVPIGAIHRSVFIRQMVGDFNERYDIDGRLGRGAYGEVLLVTLKETLEKRVCKRIMEQQEKVPEEEVATEVDLLRSLDHPHIIRIFEYFEKYGFVHIVMEPVFGGTLTHIIDKLHLDDQGEPLGERPSLLTEQWAATAISQILSALVYAHEVAGVIHKDLKTDNVIKVGKPKLDIEEQLKEPVHMMLADFGIAEVFTPLLPVDSPGSPHQRTKLIGSGRSSRIGGTPSYMSPEMFRGSFSEKCDIWSLGVIMFRLLTGEFPYKGENVLVQASAVSNRRRHPRWETLSSYGWSLSARRLCQQLLTKDEGLRPSAAQAFKSDWIMQAKLSQRIRGMDASARDALQKQQMRTHMMQMAMHALTSQLNLTQLHKLNRQFKKYDSSGDGRLSLDEMRQVLEDSGIESMEDKDMIVQSLDSDHSGKIEYSEFVAGCLDLGTESIRSQIPLAFSVFDLDNSGSVSAEELRMILTQGANDKPAASLSWSGTQTGSLNRGLLPDGMTVDTLMKELDADKNGQVDCFEFERYLLKEHERMGSMLEAVRAEPWEAQ